MLEQPKWLHHGRIFDKDRRDQWPLLHYTTMTARCERYQQLEFVFKLCTESESCLSKMKTISS